MEVAAAAAAKSCQSYPTLSDPMDHSLPGSSIHGILQARLLEWGAIAFSVNGGWGMGKGKSRGTDKRRNIQKQKQKTGTERELPKRPI